MVWNCKTVLEQVFVYLYLNANESVFGSSYYTFCS